MCRSEAFISTIVRKSSSMGPVRPARPRRDRGGRCRRRSGGCRRGGRSGRRRRGAAAPALSSTNPACVAPSRTSTRTPTDPTPATATRHSLRPVARPFRASGVTIGARSWSMVAEVCSAPWTSRSPAGVTKTMRRPGMRRTSWLPARTAACKIRSMDN